MKQLILLFISLIFCKTSFSQGVQRYENSRGESHICGAFQIEELEKDTIFQKWYYKNYNDFELSDKKQNWIKNLKNTEVDIYLERTLYGNSKA